MVQLVYDWKKIKINVPEMVIWVVLSFSIYFILEVATKQIVIKVNRHLTDTHSDLDRLIEGLV